LLRKSLNRFPGRVVLWKGLVELEVQQAEGPFFLPPNPASLRKRGLSAVVQALQESGRNLGDGMDLRLLWVNALERTGDPAADPLLLPLDANLGGDAPRDRRQLLSKLAEAHLRLGNPGQTERLAKQLAREDPEDLAARVLLLKVALQTGADERIAWAVKDLRRFEGDEVTWWRYGQAARWVVAAEQGNAAGLPRARRLLKELGRSRPTWARTSLLRARLRDLEGNSSRALETYLLALDQGERSRRAVVRAVQLLTARRRFLEADQVIRKYQVRRPLDRDLCRTAVEVALRARHFPRALALARQGPGPRPRDYRDHLWLGKVLAAAGRPAEAEEEFHRALRLGRRIPDPWVALVTFQAETGQKEQARQTMRAMGSQLPPRALPLARAQCFEALRMTEEAARQYETAGKAAPGNVLVLIRAARFYLHEGRLARAENTLRKILDLSGGVSGETRAWARRELARLQKAEGRRQKAKGGR
jgi:tetratricopeptide (TPR) repeat protein